jgi:hypothetical protein
VEEAGEEALAGAGLAEDEDRRQPPRALRLPADEPENLFPHAGNGGALSEKLA